LPAGPRKGNHCFLLLICIGAHNVAFDCAIQIIDIDFMRRSIQRKQFVHLFRKMRPKNYFIFFKSFDISLPFYSRIFVSVFVTVDCGFIDSDQLRIGFSNNYWGALIFCLLNIIYLPNRFLSLSFPLSSYISWVLAVSLCE